MKNESIRHTHGGSVRGILFNNIVCKKISLPFLMSFIPLFFFFFPSHSLTRHNRLMFRVQINTAGVKASH